MDELATTAHLRSASKHPLYLLSMAYLVSVGWVVGAVGGGWGWLGACSYPQKKFRPFNFFSFQLGRQKNFLLGYFLH